MGENGQNGTTILLLLTKILISREEEMCPKLTVVNALCPKFTCLMLLIKMENSALSLSHWQYWATDLLR